MTIATSEIRDFILEKIKDIPKTRSFDYTIFGKEIEDYISEALREYFANEAEYNSHYIAPDKNYFPDFTLNENIAFEIKAGRNDSNPENDMGTLNSWDKKLAKFDDRIYYVFVKYGCDEDGTVNLIEDIYIDKVYKFIGENSGGALKYREKDGNLRPKSWDDFKSNKSYVNDLPDFKSKLEHTDLYRAARIIDKKLESIKDSPELMKRLYDKYFATYAK